MKHRTNTLIFLHFLLSISLLFVRFYSKTNSPSTFNSNFSIKVSGRMNALIQHLTCLSSIRYSSSFMENVVNSIGNRFRFGKHHDYADVVTFHTFVSILLLVCHEIKSFYISNLNSNVRGKHLNLQNSRMTVTTGRLK